MADPMSDGCEIDPDTLDAIASVHQTDYDSVGGCVCGESYPCTTLRLVEEVRRLSDAELDAELDAEGWRREHDRLHARIAELEDGIRNHRRLMTESYMLPPRQWERDTRRYDLNLWGHVGEGTDR